MAVSKEEHKQGSVLGPLLGFFSFDQGAAQTSQDPKRTEQVFCSKMNKLFGFLLFVLYLSHASAIECYTCASTTNMADCDNGQKKTNCGGSFDRCFKMSLDFTKVAGVETKSYAKGCFTKAVCDSGNDVYKNCKKIDGAKCDFSCCEGDLCNGGTAQVVSVFLVVACALMVLFH